MIDKSDKIIIGTGILLLLTVVISNYFGLGRIIVTIDDLEVEIATSRDNYTLGESFTAKVYLVNAFSRDVSMEPISSVLIHGNSENNPTPAKMTVDINSADRRHIPAESKALFLDLPFTPEYPGEFTITCLGVQKKVLILGVNRIPRDENAWVSATVLNFEPSPTLKIVELSSDDDDIPRSLFVAIDKAILDAESVQEEGLSRVPGESRRFAMSRDEAESIIRYFGEEIEEAGMLTSFTLVSSIM